MLFICLESNLIGLNQFRYSIGPAHKFIEYETKWAWIEFGSGEENGVITGKTSNPSDISLSISILYRIRPE